MPSVTVYDLDRNKVGTVELIDSVFAADVKPHLINMAVRAQVAKRYAHKVANSMTRTEVQATGKKIYKQKGTGQARHGDIKAPIFVGGGKAHGPRPHVASYKINKKVMRAALLSSLSLHQKEDRVIVVDKMELPKPNTKGISKALSQFGLEKALIVNMKDKPEQVSFNTSAKNIRNVKFVSPEGVNVFDLLKYKHLFISKEAISKLMERLNHA